MTVQANLKTPIDTTDREQILEYLRQHPEFFDDCPNLVADIKLSHPSGDAVSLVERQISILRDQNAGFKAKLYELVETARANDHLNERMHRLTVDLLQTNSLERLIACLTDHLRNEFNADAVQIHLVDQHTESLNNSANTLIIDEELQDLFKPAFKNGRPQCGQLDPVQLNILFADDSDNIKSAAVIPLGNHASTGLLAIGGYTAERFQEQMGTLFLSRLGELLGALLKSHLSDD